LPGTRFDFTEPSLFYGLTASGVKVRGFLSCVWLAFDWFLLWGWAGPWEPSEF